MEHGGILLEHSSGIRIKSGCSVQNSIENHLNRKTSNIYDAIRGIPANVLNFFCHDEILQGLGMKIEGILSEHRHGIRIKSGMACSVFH